MRQSRGLERKVKSLRRVQDLGTRCDVSHHRSGSFCFGSSVYRKWEDPASTSPRFGLSRLVRVTCTYCRCPFDDSRRKYPTNEYQECKTGTGGMDVFYYVAMPCTALCTLKPLLHASTSSATRGCVTSPPIMRATSGGDAPGTDCFSGIPCCVKVFLTTLLTRLWKSLLFITFPRKSLIPNCVKDSGSIAFSN